MTEKDSRRVVGYVRLVDLYLGDSERIDSSLKLPEIESDASPIAALLRLQSNRDMLASVVDKEGNAVGIVTTRELMQVRFSQLTTSH